MKTQLRLNSVVPHGVGSGFESLALDLIYEFLLSEFGQNFYRWIGIKNGTPVAREPRALNDVEQATGQKPDFVPYNNPMIFTGH